MTKWILKEKAKKFYPQSLSMRCQWIRQTVELHKRGIAMTLTGSFPTGRA